MRSRLIPSCALSFGLLLITAQTSGAVVVGEPYLFVEHKNNQSGTEQFRLQFGADLDLGSTITSAIWTTNPVLGGLPPSPLTDFGLVKIGSHPIRQEFGAIILGDFAPIGSRELVMTLEDSTGATSTVTLAALPTSITDGVTVNFLPLISDLTIAPDGRTLSWNNPADAATLASLGVDAIRVRIIDPADTLAGLGPIFHEVFSSETSDLTLASFMLPDIASVTAAPNPLIRVEIIDFGLLTQAIDGVTDVVQTQLNRSTFERRLQDIAVVALPVPAPMPVALMISGLVILGFAGRRNRRPA